MFACLSLIEKNSFSDEFDIDITRKLSCHKDDHAMCPIWVSWKFSGVPDYAHGYFPQHFYWALPVHEITAIGVLGGGCKPTILGKRRP